MSERQQTCGGGLVFLLQVNINMPAKDSAVRPKQYISAFRIRQTFEHYMAFSLFPSLWTISRPNHNTGLWIIRSGGERITSASSRSLWHRTLQKTLRGSRLIIHFRWPVPEPSKQFRALRCTCSCIFMCMPLYLKIFVLGNDGVV